jgi:hypothetical protein
MKGNKMISDPMERYPISITLRISHNISPKEKEDLMPEMPEDTGY